MHDMFPYKATQFETQHLCFSLSLHQACIKERREGKKKGSGLEKKCQGMTQIPEPGFVKQQSPKEGASTAYTWSKVEKNTNTWH